ncbi:MAG: ribosome silencing factor [Thermosynechococcaceae cyanobacterium]
MATINQPASNRKRSPERIQQLAYVLAQAADERKGGDVLVLNVQDVSYLADFFVVSTGFSRPQVRAIADAMEKAAIEQCDRHPNHIEGGSESNWIVLDYGDVIAHVMLPDQRQYYALEAFWAHAERLPFPLPSTPEA